MTSNGPYSITALCRLLGTTPRTLRYYEQLGLLAPTRANLRRRYDRRDFQRARVILEARRVGLEPFHLEACQVCADLAGVHAGKCSPRVMPLSSGGRRLVRYDGKRAFHGPVPRAT